MPEVSLDRLIVRGEDDNKGIQVDPGRIIQQGVQGKTSPLKRALASSYRPALEGGGMIGGAVLAVPTAAATGPVGPALGGVTGYVIGKNAADALDQWLGVAEPKTLSQEIREMPGEVATGMAYESVGPVIKATGRGLYRLSETIGLNDFLRGIRTLFPGISDSGILKKARQLLIEIRGGDYGKKTKQSENLLKQLEVKTQPTFGQKTGSPKAASFEQSASAKDAALKALLLKQDAQINAEATQYIKNLQKTGASADDIIAAVDRHTKTLKTKMTNAQQALEQKMPSPTATPQQTGLAIKEELQAGKALAKKTVEQKYKAVPDVIVNPEPMKKALKTVLEDIKLRRGDKNTIPSGIMGQITSKLKLKKAPTRPAGYIVALPEKQKAVALQFEKLRAWSSQIDEEIRAATRGANPNLNLARRLNMLRDGIVESMDDLLKMESKYPEAVKRLKEAHKFFIKNYLEPYRLGTVADVLQKGFQVGGSKIPYSDIPARFFSTGKLDAADDLIRAVGQKKAAGLINEFAEGQFATVAINQDGHFMVGSAQRWLAKNQTILAKYGLLDKFRQIVNLGRASKAAMTQAKAYEQTMAKVVLRADSQKLFKEIFTKRSTEATMKELLTLPGIQGNKAAINGVKAEFNQFLLKEMEVSGVDVLGNPIRTIAKAKNVLSKYSPAMKVLYKDNPEHIKALLNYHKLLQMLGRNKIVTYAGGPTTAEKLMSSKTMVNDLFGKATQMAAVMKQRGWIFSSAKNLFKALWNAPKKYANERIELLLREAIHNPSVAKTLMDAAEEKIGPNLLARKLDTHFAALNAYTAHKSLGALLDETSK